MNVHGRFRDDAEATFTTEDHLPHTWTSGGRGNRPCRQYSGRRDDTKGSRQVRNIPVFVGLHPRRSRRNPASKSGVFEAVRKMSERPAFFIQLPFDVGAKSTRLNAGEA